MRNENSLKIPKFDFKNSSSLLIKSNIIITVFFFIDSGFPIPDKKEIGDYVEHPCMIIYKLKIK